MMSKFVWYPILWFLFFVEFGTLSSFAQGRIFGKTRNGGTYVGGEAVRDPLPQSDDRREMGRTRQADPVVPPVSKEPRDVGRRDPEPPSSSAERAPQPPPQRLLPRPPVPDQPQPEPVIGEGGDCGGIPIDGVVDPSSLSGGNLIREGVCFGKDVTLADSYEMPEYSGFDFSENLKRPFDHPFADMFIVQEDGKLMMRVWKDAEIMDIGPVSVPVDAIYLRRSAWSLDHAARLFHGHEYVVRTWDHHFGKFCVTGMLNDRVTFDWAYQYGEHSPWRHTIMVTRDLTRGKFRQ